MLMLRIGGVPEHYNLPWHLMIESGKLNEIGVNLCWQDCPGGTGEMTSLLNAKELDLAVLLTEGIVSDILKQSDSKILKVYVQSSLEWGVHLLQEDEIDIDASKNLVFGISRKGSGSHLMATLYAQQSGISQDRIAFRVVDDFDGAMKAFQKRQIDVFLWERFTTEPYCEPNNLYRAGSVFTPWPCFVIAVRMEYYMKNQNIIDKVTQSATGFAAGLKRDPKAVTLISDRYQLPVAGVKKWFERVEWGSGQNLTPQELEEVIFYLKKGENTPESDAKINWNHFLINLSCKHES